MSMGNRATLSRTTLKGVVDSMPHNFNWDNEEAFRKPNCLKRILKCFPLQESFNLLVKGCTEYPINSVAGRLYRSLLEELKNEVRNEELVYPYWDELMMRPLCFGDHVASIVLDKLKAKGICLVRDMQYVSFMDLRKLNISSKQLNHLLCCLQGFDKWGVIERFDDYE